jgi:hypothetical protein
MLTARQQRAIEALLVERNITNAAKAAKVSRRTLHAWLTDAQFCSELHRSANDVMESSVRRLKALSASAVDALEDSMQASVKPAVRVRAADVTLAKLMHLSEFTELEQRLAALEERLNDPVRTTNRTSRKFRG